MPRSKILQKFSLRGIIKSSLLVINKINLWQKEEPPLVRKRNPGVLTRRRKDCKSRE